MKRSTGFAVLSATAAAVLLTGCGEAKKIDKLLSNGDYSEAVDLYESAKLSDSEREKLAKTLRERLETTIKNFAAGEISYKVASRTVSAIIEMDILSVSDDAASALSKIDELNQSKENYKLAEQYMEEEKLVQAYAAYMGVIEEDSNYADAQTKAQNVAETYYLDVKAEATTLINKDDYSNAVSLVYKATKNFDYEKLNNYFDEIRAAYLKKIFTDVDAAIAEDDYSTASSLLYNVDYLDYWTDAEAQQITDKYNEVNEAKAFHSYEIYRDQYITKVDEYLAAGEYSRAFIYLEYARCVNEEYSAKDDVYLAKEKEVNEAFIEYTNSLIDPYLEAKSYYGAVELLDKALWTKEVEELKDKRDELAESMPLYIAGEKDADGNSIVSLGSGASQYRIDNDEIVSSHGKEYLVSGASYRLNGSSGSSWSSGTTGTMTINLNGQYSKLTGIIDSVGADVTDLNAVTPTAAPEEVALLTVSNGGEERSEAENDGSASGDATAASGDVTATSGDTTSASGDTTADSGENTPDLHEDPTEDLEGYSSTNAGTLYIYGDDGQTVIYSRKVNGTTAPSSFELDVKDLTKITVKFNVTNGDYYALLYDWALVK